MGEYWALGLDCTDLVALSPNGCRTQSSRLVIVELQIFCRNQIGLKFVAPSAYRTLANFLTRLTALRLRAPIPLTY